MENENTNLSELCQVGDVVWELIWCLRENEMAILKRTEKTMIRAMCGVKSIEKRSSLDLMDLLGLEETLDSDQSERNAMVWACSEKG